MNDSVLRKQASLAGKRVNPGWDIPVSGAVGHPEKMWGVGVCIGPGLRREIWADCRASGVTVNGLGTWERMRALGNVGMCKEGALTMQAWGTSCFRVSSWEGMERMWPARSEEDERVGCDNNGTVRKVKCHSAGIGRKPEKGDRTAGQGLHCKR